MPWAQKASELLEVFFGGRVGRMLKRSPGSEMEKKGESQGEQTEEEGEESWWQYWLIV